MSGLGVRPVSACAVEGHVWTGVPSTGKLLGCAAHFLLPKFGGSGRLSAAPPLTCADVGERAQSRGPTPRSCSFGEFDPRMSVNRSRMSLEGRILAVTSTPKPTSGT